MDTGHQLCDNVDGLAVCADSVPAGRGRAGQGKGSQPNVSNAMSLHASSERTRRGHVHGHRYDKQAPH